jgi:TM2 domain-containing membrane protein YozV
MNNKNSFITFITACIPGVGYMYNGLIKKGVQVLFLYLLIGPILSFIGLSFLSHLIKICIWFYTFFDTFAVSNKIKRGEYVPDSEFILKNYVNMNNSHNENITWNGRINKQGWVILGSSLIILGGLSILNQIFIDNDIYKYIRSYASQYFIPIVLIVIGISILFKKRE